MGSGRKVAAAVGACEGVGVRVASSSAVGKGGAGGAVGGAVVGGTGERTTDGVAVGTAVPTCGKTWAMASSATPLDVPPRPAT